MTARHSEAKVPLSPRHMARDNYATHGTGKPKRDYIITIIIIIIVII
jgi:hypothetical protein